MEEKSGPPTTFTQLNSMGELETIDMLTGATINHSRLHEYDRHTYTLAKSEAICDLVRKGYTLTKIGQMPGMPSSSVIFRWKTLHPDFTQKIQAAKLDRAEHFHDKVLDVIEGVHDDPDKDRAALAALKVQGYKWLAEVGDPNQYGKKTKITGDSTQPVTFILDTGIRKSPPPDLAREQNAIIESASTMIAQAPRDNVHEVTHTPHPADFVAAEDFEE